MPGPRVAVVGAGAAGAGAAYALRDGAAVTVFEAGDRVGGRAATRRRGDRVYDYGANYVKADDDRVAALVSSFDEDLVDVRDPVWTFDGAGTISEGRDADDHKWSYRAGIDTLVRRLVDASGATVRTGTRVTGLARRGDRWRLSVEGEAAGPDPFDAVVVTPPAPETADLLRASDWDDPLRAALADALAAVPYRTIHSVLLGYRFELDRPWYALVNVDREHDVSWLSRESCKPGHVPAGEELLVVQMAPGWSREHAGDPGAVAAVPGLVAGLLGDERLADPDWTDDHRWRHALADGAPDADLLARAREHGLAFAGDWVAGEGRVHLALRSGLDAGDRLQSSSISRQGPT